METVKPWYKDLRIQYISDLHLECGGPFVVEKNGDVLVIAGDCFTAGSIGRFQDFLTDVMELGFKAVIYVLGNHEGYGWTYEEAIHFLRKLEARCSEFHFLHQSAVTIDGVRFIGCPLWSHPDPNAQIHAKLYINDYRAVKNWSLDRHIEAHYIDKEWLANSILPQDVVVTHFPPTRNGTDEKKFGPPEKNVLGSWFVNNMPEEIRIWQPGMWISGHTHHVWDEQVFGCRDVGNCRGYSKVHFGTGQPVAEVKGFNPTKTITYKVYDEVANGRAAGAA
jgi:Icc-related predicted phosphoesterase